jgi:glycosyltransferase involved in cell wall biosynthesis
MGPDTLLLAKPTKEPHLGVGAESPKTPLVSVIIPTKNSERTIRRCLESVRTQTYRNVEIVVVDNFSLDSTVRIAKQYADVVLLAGPERTSQVKQGAAISKGDFVYKIDSDFVLEPSVLEKAVRVALDHKAVAVVIPNLSYPKISFWSEVRFFERLSYVGSKRIEAARFIRHDAYDTVGGHDGTLVAYEEYDLHNKVSRLGKIVRIEGASEWHIGEPKRLADIVTTSWYYGKTAIRYVRRYPHIAAIQVLPVRRPLLNQRKVFLHRPKLLLGLTIYETAKYLSGFLGLLAQVTWPFSPPFRQLSQRQMTIDHQLHPASSVHDELSFMQPSHLFAISIVIPTYNSRATLSRCLASIRSQTYTPEAVIVVDRFSRDGTPDVAMAEGAKVIGTEVNRSLARNIGLRSSSSGGVLFVDADMILPPSLIKECETGLTKHDALIIPEISVGRGFWAECKAAERKTYIRNEMIEAARCFRKEALLSLGGYNPRLEAGEDWDLQIRAKAIGLSIGRTAATIEHDEGEPTLLSLLRKKYFYGKMFGTYLAMNPYEGVRQLNPLRRIFSPMFATLPKDPVHGVGVMMLRALEFGAAGLGHISKIIAGKAGEGREKQARLAVTSS